MTLGTIILVIVAAGILVLFETLKAVPEEGKWATPKYIEFEVVAVGLLIFGGITVWSWLKRP